MQGRNSSTGPPSVVGKTGRLVLLLVAATMSGSACEPDPENLELIPRDTFIDAYVDLRVEALRNEGELSDERRGEILADHDVSGEDLLAFVEGHGTELHYMRDLWNEIETRIDSVPPIPPDEG